MNKHTTVTLPEHQKAFAEAQVAEGVYGSVSEVVQAGLRLLEEQEAALSNLRAALVEGEQSAPIDFDPEAFLEQLHAGNAQAR